MGATKERPILFSGPMIRALLEGRKTQTRRVVKPRHVARLLADDQSSGHEFCPYGQPGDRLWVRETFQWSDVEQECPMYAADGVKCSIPWRPSIHMPRRASRLTLEVTEVRVQRLQEISEADATAEGVQAAPFCRSGRPAGMEHVEAFEELWQSINGERPGCSWDKNPFVWAISFRRAE